MCSISGKNSRPPSSLQPRKLHFYVTYCSELKTVPQNSCLPGTSECYHIWKYSLCRLNYLRSYRFGWALNPMANILIRGEDTKKDTRVEGHVKMDAEIGVMCL